MSGIGAVVAGIGAAPALTCNPTPSSATGSRSGPGSSTVTTNSVSAVASGGVPPYSYAWAKFSGDDVVINSPISSSTTFASLMSGDQELTGIYRVTVTDSIGQQAVGNVPVDLTSTSGA